MMNISYKRTILFLAAAGILFVSLFFYQLSPIFPGSAPKIFEVAKGDGFLEIVQRLRGEKLIRSVSAFEIYSLLTWSAWQMKPGIYELSGKMDSREIAGILSRGREEIEVKISDGASVYDVDALLSSRKVLPSGSLVSYAQENDIEGKLYPDTYKFFTRSTNEEVVKKFLDNFEVKAGGLLRNDQTNYEKNLILASLVQKEISDENDSKIVAGILKKRLSAGMKLDVDATICYLKKVLKNTPKCYPLTEEDFKIESPYNTYLYSGLPPGPIGNPNAAAISAALNSSPSQFWFYLSDPKTGKTIFSETLEEQNRNRAVYLKRTT